MASLATGVNRRGVTLIELLLAIGLLLALSAITLPAILTSFKERAFESSAEIVRNQLLLARAHAQATGKPVEVRYDADPPRVAGRYFEIALEDAVPEGEDPQDTLAISENWADRALADGVRIADRPPDQEDDVLAGVEGPTETIRLVVFMPDGSALLGRPVWVHDDHDRLAKISVNPWTGLPAVERDVGETEPPEDEDRPDEIEPDPEFGDEDQPDEDEEVPT